MVIFHSYVSLPEGMFLLIWFVGVGVVCDLFRVDVGENFGPDHVFGGFWRSEGPFTTS